MDHRLPTKNQELRCRNERRRYVTSVFRVRMLPQSAESYRASPIEKSEDKGHQGRQFRNLIWPVLLSSCVLTTQSRYGMTSRATLSICVPFAIFPRLSLALAATPRWTRLLANSFHGICPSAPPSPPRTLPRLCCRALFENTVLVNT